MDIFGAGSGASPWKRGLLVESPRLHVLRYRGVLAPRSRARTQIVRGRRREVDCTGGTNVAAAHATTDGGAAPVHTLPSGGTDPAGKPSAGGRRTTRGPILLKRTFKVDVLHCDLCGGRMKLVALVRDPNSVQGILKGVGLPIGPPPRAPA